LGCAQAPVIFTLALLFAANAGDSDPAASAAAKIIFKTE
jgi:hypothetical protein